MISMIITGSVAIVVSASLTHKDEYEDDHKYGIPLEEFIENVSNWIIWVIFGIILVVNLVLFIHFNKRRTENKI